MRNLNHSLQNHIDHLHGSFCFIKPESKQSEIHTLKIKGGGIGEKKLIYRSSANIYQNMFVHPHLHGRYSEM